MGKGKQTAEAPVMDQGGNDPFFDVVIDKPAAAPEDSIEVEINRTHFSVEVRDVATGDKLREQSVQAVLLAEILSELRMIRKAGAP